MLYSDYVTTMHKLGLEPGTKFVVSENGYDKGTWKYKKDGTWEVWTTDLIKPKE